MGYNSYMDSFKLALSSEIVTKTGSLSDNCFTITSNALHAAVAVSAMIFTWSGTMLLIFPIT